MSFGHNRPTSRASIIGKVTIHIAVTSLPLKFVPPAARLVLLAISDHDCEGSTRLPVAAKAFTTPVASKGILNALTCVAYCAVAAGAGSGAAVSGPLDVDNLAFCGASGKEIAAHKLSFALPFIVLGGGRRSAKRLLVPCLDTFRDGDCSRFSDRRGEGVKREEDKRGDGSEELH